MSGTSYTIVRKVKYGPQAQDDTGSGHEDYILLVDVLANDLASGANELWSLDQDNPGNRTAEGTIVTLASGATIRFEGGQVVYDPNGSFEHLAEGQEATDTFTYAIRMANGVVSYATVTVTIEGANDGPVAIADVATATEDGAIVAGNVGDNDSDADNGATLSFALDAPAPAGLSFNPDGSWSFDPSDPAYQDLAAGQTLDIVVAYTVTDDMGATASSTLTITVTGTNDGPVAAADTAAGLQNDTLTIDVLGNDTDVDQGAVLSVVDASVADGQGSVSIVDNQLVFAPAGDFDYLSAGQTATVTIGYTIADEHGAESTSTVTVTVTGTNQGPAIGAGDFTGAVIEAEPVTGIPAEATPILAETGGANDLFAEAQLIDRADLRIADNANLGDDSDPSISIQGSINSATDQDVYAIQLQPGETITLDVDFGLGYGSTDYSGYGGIPGLDAFVSIYDADGNLLNLNDDAPTGLGGSGSAYVQDSYLQFTAGTAGTYYIVVHDYNDLGAMSQGPYTLQVSVDSQALQITDGGSFAFTDIDLADGHDVTVTAGGEGYLGTLTAGVDDPSTGDGAGTIRWDFSVANAAVQYLAEGQTLVQTYTVAVSDGQGGTADEVVTIAITGTNDVPVITNALSGGDVFEDGPLGVAGHIDFAEVDLTDGHSVTAAADEGGYYGAFTATLADSATGDGAGRVEWSFSVDEAQIAHLGAGDWLLQRYTITIDDGNGGTTQQLVNVRINGSNDGPVLSAGGDVTGEVAELANNAPGENATLHVTEGSFGFTDADVSDAHSIAGITPAGDDYYGVLTATVDSATREVNWSFAVEDSAIDGLAAGETVTQTYTIELTDSAGATVSRNVTVTITGAADNSPPDAVDDLNLVASAVGNSSFSAAPDFSGWTVNTALSSNFINTYGAPYSSASISRTPDGDGMAVLTFGGYISQPGGNGYGPTITSDAFSANAGDVVSFDWLLSSGGDHALGTGVLRDAVTGAVVATVFNFNTGFSGSTGWRHTDVTLATSGTFVMEFRVGSYDSTFGQAVGATMQLDFAGVLPRVHEDAPLTIQTAQLLENDTDPDGDTLVVAEVSAISTLGASVVLNGDGTITYDPGAALNYLALGQSAEDSFTYTISDGNGGADTATVTLTVAGRNDTPTAADDSATTDEDTVIVVDVLANDDDADDGAVLTLVDATAAGGSVSIVGNQLHFDPGTDFDYLDEGESTLVTIDYTVEDEHGAQSSATLMVTVTGNGPLASPDSFVATEDETLVIPAASLLANDSGPSLAVHGIDDTGTQGLVRLADESVTYTPGSAFQYLGEGETATDTFTYTILDSSGETSTATVTVTVTGENDSPTAGDDSAFTLSGTSIAVDVLDNDSDPEGDSLAISGATDGAHGTVTVNEDGTLNYTPVAGFSGTDSFEYTVVDSSGASDTGTVTVVVGRADHDTVGGDVFLQGNYMEIGVSRSGSLGTANAAPSNYHPQWGSRQISYVVDTDGWGTGAAPRAGDFTLPGSPVDTIGFGFDGLSFIQDERSGRRDINTTTTDISADGRLATMTTGVITSGGRQLRVTQVIELDPNATYYQTTITVENIGTTTLTDVRFLRSFDPDQDNYNYGAFATYNDVIANPTGDSDLALARALGHYSGVSVNLVAFDDGARVSNYGFNNWNVYAAQAWQAPVDRNGAYVDEAISLAFQFGNLAPGETATNSFYTSLNGSSDANDMLTGTSGNDLLNSGGGDDILIGAGGNDVLTGGSGDDTFIFNAGAGDDRITDFQAGAGSDDVIELRGTELSSFAEVRSAALQVGSDVQIDLGGGNVLTIAGVSLANLHSEDFTFA